VWGVQQEGGEAGGWTAAHTRRRRRQERKSGMVVVELRVGRRRWRSGSKEGIAAAARGRPGGGEAARVNVQAGVLLFPLGAPVLEPDLHLKAQE
jgi:hypothetical protein